METGSAASGNGLSQSSRMRAQFECPFCGDKTQFLQDLMNHLMANHVWLSTSETLALQCPRCSICFVDSVESLINHFRLSHNEFKCLWLLNLVTNVKYMTALIVKVEKKRVAVIRSAYPIDFVDLTTEDTNTNVDPIGLDQIVNSSHGNKDMESSAHPTPIKVELLKEETVDSASLKSLCLEDSPKNSEESESRIEALPRCPHCPKEVKSVGEFIVHMKEHGDNAYVNWKEYTNNLVKSQRISQIEDQLHLKQFIRSVLDNIGNNGIVPVTSAPGIKASENTETPRVVESVTLSTTANPDVSKSAGTEGVFDWLMVRDEKNPAWTQFDGQVISESVKNSGSLPKKRKIQPKKSPKSKKPKVKRESVADVGVSSVELVELGEPKNQKLESGRAEAEDDAISIMNTDTTASPVMSDEELTKSAQNTVPKITLSSEFLKSLVLSRGNAPLPLDVDSTLIQAAKDIVSGAAPVEEIARKKRRVPSQHWIKPKPYQCDICGEQSANRLRHDLHMTEHRMMDNPYWCTVKGCKFCSTSRTLLFHHVSSVHPFVEKDAIERMYLEGDERKRILEAEENDRRSRAKNLATPLVSEASYIIREPPSLTTAVLCPDDIPAVESEVIVKTEESAIARGELEPRSPTSSPPPTPARTSPPPTLEALLTGSASYSPSPSPTPVPTTASPSAVQLLSTFFESQHSQMPSWLARAAADIDRVKGEVPHE